MKNYRLKIAAINSLGLLLLLCFLFPDGSEEKEKNPNYSRERGQKIMSEEASLSIITETDALTSDLYMNEDSPLLEVADSETWRGINERSLQEYEMLTAPGYVIREVATTHQGEAIGIEVGASQWENKLTLQGNSTGVENVLQAKLNPNASVVYYSTFQPTPELGAHSEIQPTGQLWKLDLQNLMKAELIHAFTEANDFDFEVGESEILYVLANGEFGRFPLNDPRPVIIDQQTLSAYAEAVQHFHEDGVAPHSHGSAFSFYQLGEEGAIIEVRLASGEVAYERLWFAGVPKE